jgi:hypothetical protein
VHSFPVMGRSCTSLWAHQDVREIAISPTAMAMVPTHNYSNIIVVHSFVATARHCTNLSAHVVVSFALSLQIEVAQKETIIYQITFYHSGGN